MTIYSGMPLRPSAYYCSYIDIHSRACIECTRQNGEMRVSSVDTRETNYNMTIVGVSHEQPRRQMLNHCHRIVTAGPNPVNKSGGGGGAEQLSKVWRKIAEAHQ